MNSSGHFASWVLCNFCDGHYYVLFWLCSMELCHDLLKYRYDYFEHVWAVCIMSLNWVTWYLLLVVPQGAEFRPVQLRATEAAVIAVCCCAAPSRRIVLSWYRWRRTAFPGFNWLTAKMLLDFASTVNLGFESHGTHDLILLPDGCRSLQIALPSLQLLTGPAYNISARTT
jgi:hypothetical protein